MVLSPGRLFGIAKLTEVLDMATGGGDSTDSRESVTMLETGSPTSIFVISRTEERDGYENECFTITSKACSTAGCQGATGSSAFSSHAKPSPAAPSNAHWLSASSR